MNENAGAPKKAARLTGALLARKGMATPAGFVRVATESPRPTAAVAEAEATAEGGESRAAPVLAVDSGQATLALGDEGAPETGPEEAKNPVVDGDWASLSDISIGPRFREAAAQAAAARSGSAVAEQSGKSDAGVTPRSPAGGDAGASDGRGPAPLAANDRGRQAAEALTRAPTEGAGTDPVKAGKRAEPLLTGAAAKTTPQSPPPPPARDGRPASGGGMRPAEGWAPARRVSPELADPRPRRAAPAMSTRPRKPRRRRRVLPGFVSVLALAVFLLVSWTVYQIGQGEPGADNQDGGSSGLLASAEELGFAVSQMFAAITGRLDETPGPDTGGEADSLGEGFVAEIGPDVAPTGAEVAGVGLDEAGPDEAGLDEVGQETGPEVVELETGPEVVGLETGPEVVELETGPEVVELDAEVAVPADSGSGVAVTVGDAGAGTAGVDDVGVDGVVGADIGGAPVVQDAVAVGAIVESTIQAAAGGDTVERPANPPLLAPRDVAQGLPSAADVGPAPEGRVEVAVAPASGPNVGPASGPNVGPASGSPVAPASGLTDAPVGAPIVEEAPESAPVEAVAEVAAAVAAGTGTVPEPQGPRSLIGVPVPKPDVLARAGSANAEAVAAAGSATPAGAVVVAPTSAGADEGAPAEVVAAVDVSVPGYAVQLSSLRDEAAARREWARLSEELADVLGTTELTVEAGTVSARGTFYRVLTTRFAQQSDARAICEAIRGLGQDCLVVRQR